MGDTNYRSWWGEKGLVLYGAIFPIPGIEPKAFSDMQKFSLCEDTLVDSCVIYTGRENGADAVRGKNYRWKNCDFRTRGKAFGALTIKGAIDGWELDGCNFDGKDATVKYDIELGQFDNYWYPFRPATKNGRIINCTSDKAIVVEVWNADAPTVVNSNVKVIKKPWYIWFPYFCYRYISIRFTNLTGKTNIKTK